MLVAIAIPVFTTQLERSREATDLSNIRSAYAEAVADYLANGAQAETQASVTRVNQTVSKWQTSAKLYTRVDGKEAEVNIPEYSGKKKGWTVTVSAGGTVSVAEK